MSGFPHLSPIDFLYEATQNVKSMLANKYQNGRYRFFRKNGITVKKLVVDIFSIYSTDFNKVYFYTTFDKL